MRKFLLIAIAALAFAACSDNDRAPRRYTVTFDGARLGESEYLWGKPFAISDGESMVFEGEIYREGKAAFLSYFNDFYGTWDTWCRFAVSTCDDKKTEGLDNQFSVYTTLAEDGNAFAVAYEMQGMGPGYTFNPAVEFSAPVTPASIRLANNTWTYLYLSKKYSDFAVKIIGFNGDSQTGTLEVPLAAGNKIAADWVLADLHTLGKVTSLVFAVVCKDVMAPTYFCMDDLTYEE